MTNTPAIARSTKFTEINIMSVKRKFLKKKVYSKVSRNNDMVIAKKANESCNER
jgi:hypothetical protein